MQRPEKMRQWGTGRAKAGQRPERRGYDADYPKPSHVWAAYVSPSRVCTVRGTGPISPG